MIEWWSVACDETGRLLVNRSSAGFRGVMSGFRLIDHVKMVLKC